MLLVGEGNVGKTSLSAALRDDEFIEGRPFTHGINIQSMVLRQPDASEDTTIRLWDFGGQEVHRITHQFFFSQRALYVVVWKPREGQEQNEVEAWLRRIRLRVGSAAQVLIVATHCADEKYPDLDYPQLQRQFQKYWLAISRLIIGAAMALGKCGKPSRDKQRDFRRWARRSACDGLQSGMRSWNSPALSPRFLSMLSLTCVAAIKLAMRNRAPWRGICMSLARSSIMARMRGCRIFVVLNPEWLTTAISYVLRDDPTREAGGILDHTRLRYIWQSEAGYPVRYHRYFLRLMEKFDISYRLEDEQRSLIAQLVPYPQAGPAVGFAYSLD